MKEELYNALMGHGVKYIDVWDTEIRAGEALVPTRIISVYATDRDEPHIYVCKTDAPVDKVAAYYKEHLRNRT